MRHARAAGLCLGLAVLLASQVWVLYWMRPGDERFEPSAATIVPSLEVSGATDLSQSFTVKADGLEAITIHASAVGGTPPGLAELSLSSPDLPVPVTARVRAADLVAAPAYTWQLPRIASSAGRPFVLTVRVPEAAVGQGIRFAVGPPEYTAGELRIGGRLQWADLRFRAWSRRSRTVDLLGGLPAPFDDGGVIVGLCVLLDAVLLGLAGAITSPATEAAPSTAPTGIRRSAAPGGGRWRDLWRSRPQRTPPA